MSKNIKFTLVFENVSDMFYPKPASECIPDWYKELELVYEEYMSQFPDKI